MKGDVSRRKGTGLDGGNADMGRDGLRLGLRHLHSVTSKEMKIETPDIFGGKS